MEGDCSAPYPGSSSSTLRFASLDISYTLQYTIEAGVCTDWLTLSPSPFPTVADAVQTEVNDYKASEEEVMRLKSVMVRLSLSVSPHSFIL